MQKDPGVAHVPVPVRLAEAGGHRGAEERAANGVSDAAG